MSLENIDGLFLGSGDLSFAPAAGASAALVLYKQMAAADLALALPSRIGVSRRSMMLSHVDLQLLGIGIGGGFPTRFLGGGVEVIWEVLRVRMTNFPAGR